MATSRGPSSGLTSQLLGQAAGIVAYAQGRIDVVDSYIEGIDTAVLSLTAPTITPSFPTGGEMPSVAVPSAPTIEVPTWVAPGIPTAFTGDLDVSDLEIAPFDAELPDINYLSPPEAFSQELTDAPTISLEYEEPTLSVSLPAAPDLLSISVTPFSGIDIPTFSETSPELVAVAPSIREYVPGSQYTSDLLTSVKAQLLARIQGGYGLGAEAETALWDRGREREARGAADALADLERMEALGFMLPPGVYADARIKIITETDYAARGHSREAMIESARLELDQVKHALTSAVQLESQLMDYTNAVEQRLFEASRYATEAGIQIYNAQVQAYASMVNAYQAKVAAYEARVRAEVQKVEAYKAQISAEETKARVNQALVDQYRARIEAALSSIRVFEAQISAIQAKADIEKTKVMLFGEQVRAYVAQVNAYTAGVEGFRASLQAEQTKQQVYQSQVDAFTARVNASARQIDARIAAYKGRIDAKVAEYDGYRAAVQGESSRVQSYAQIGSTIYDGYKAEVAAISTHNEVLLKQWQAVLDQNQRTAEIGISAAKANAELYVTTRSLALDAAKAGAQVAAQIGSAALNAVNFSGSVSSSEGYSASDSYSEAVSVSSSTSSSNSVNQNYNYSV